MLACIAKKIKKNCLIKKIMLSWNVFQMVGCFDFESGWESKSTPPPPPLLFFNENKSISFFSSEHTVTKLQCKYVKYVYHPYLS